jgi:hypothetical protein
VIEEQRILERNGLPAKDILKAAVAAIEEKIKAVDKADNIPIIKGCIKKHICKLHSRRGQLLQADAMERRTDVFKLNLSITR